VSEGRIHRAVSDDGTEVVGRIRGNGPPLVLISGTGDGENRPFLVGELSEHFTCYSMSLRSRGLSAPNPDHAPERLVQDIVSFVNSIGRPVGLAAHSRGAAQALGAAARTDAVSALAVYEPHVVELYDDDDVARAGDALGRMQAAANEGHLAEAARVFFEDITLASHEELAVLSGTGTFDLMAPAMPIYIRDLSRWQLPRSIDALHLEHATMPVLLLHGTRSHRFYTKVARGVAEHLPHPHVREAVDAGHFSPLFEPGPIADEFHRFLAAAAA
jgi:pimeloyl-ACP methyl ester carboxylesterase